MEKSVERSCHGKVLRRVGGLLASIGFRRARSTFFIRRQEWVVEFIHLHKYSFAPSYRVHLGIRVLNDVFPVQALNGPNSHPYTCGGSPDGSRYSFDFRSDQASIEGCSAEIHRWCAEVGLPWFNQFHDPNALLTDGTSPLDENEKARLRLAMACESDPDAVGASKSLFGLADDL